jgi:2-polyprenyl-6-methoxyphenol hydroxylase-like FAD-dependent oxidoreductase
MKGGTFSVLLVRPAADKVLSKLRYEAAFSAACQAIPGLSAWIDPGRARPITPVLPGGPLLNAYRGQSGHDGQLALPGLLFVGDAVATTTPTFGRGVTTTLLQVEHLLQLITSMAATRSLSVRASTHGAPSSSSRGSMITSGWTSAPGAAGKAWTSTWVSRCRRT